MSTRPSTPSPWLIPIKWCSGGFAAGAASVGLAWGVLGGRVEQPVEPARQETILADRAAPIHTPAMSGAEGGVQTEPTSPQPADSSLVASEQSEKTKSQTPVTEEPPRPAAEPASVDPQPAPADPAPPTPTAPVLRINVNSATLAELDLLPGIGPALAQRIIDERTQHGRFVSLRDLERVKGIGPKTVEKLQGLVVFE